MAPAFVEEAFGLGVTHLSPKVSRGICYGVGADFSFIFRLLTKHYVMPMRMRRHYTKEVVTGRG